MYEYDAELIRVVDGDTVDAMIDLGMTVWIKKRIRFHGVDTWESRTRDKQEKAKGLLAKARTKELLSENMGKFRLKSMGIGKYGRVLGVLTVEGREKSVNDMLIDEGHAYTYDGGKKKAFRGIQNDPEC
jgi:micrococcal nuclease|tara:strand:+ start:483 stop:869 length:387 start_codon:yes stop_codon:yes gene_type:complete